MRQIVRMILVLTVISAVCGAGLSGLRHSTAERIEQQILNNVQGPKVKVVLSGSENDLIADRRRIKIEEEDKLLFVGKKKDKPWAIAYETVGKGFGGYIKVMVGYNLEQNILTGVQVIEHKETPGLGSRVTEDQFTGRFRGLFIDVEIAPEGCPKDIDAISGATYSSRGVCEAIQKSIALYPAVKEQVVKR